ncbi:AraC family transcriptional regulator [Paenibacillus barcinonensis]|uniref:AraC family transcriptional regulator n=1 Tax=Paenibacillus barcinonensis TaxID=198119 RepID=UPI001C10D290|nr:AraC family transcriptional regulator [Paenibacillus barcinonensis]MBU5351496.1 AraC family transcriptional regulator [Paenibacillus barcinonensis]
MKAAFSPGIKIHPGFWDSLNQLGITMHDIAEEADVIPSSIHESEVTQEQYFSIWQAYSNLVGDTAEAIVRLTKSFEVSKYPPSVLAAYHARDYRDALVRMTRYKQICPPERLHMREAGDRCFIQLDWHHSEAGPALLIGTTLAFLLELGRRGTGQSLVAEWVEFTHPMGDVKTLETFFGCEVRTGSRLNQLTLNRLDLDLAFQSYNVELLDILTPILDKSLAGHPYQSLSEVVKCIFKRNLSDKRLDIYTIARELHMSERSLQRKLMQEGTTFKQLLTEARHEQARAYLSDLSLDIKEIAYLIGYQDQNSFYRAFRTWEGDTPSNWRVTHV